MPETTKLRRTGPARTRIEKADDTRRALLRAAANVVGRYGYADASVIRITSEAGIAHGTFYNYFETRQHLFDQLLPVRGEEILNFIKEQVAGKTTGLARERLRITAYFEFCAKNPGFLRILNEAEIFAPRAFKEHMKRFSDGYIRALRRGIQRGEILGYTEQELEVVVHVLMGARSYLTALWDRRRGRRTVPSDIIATYLKMLETPLFASHQTARAKTTPAAGKASDPLKHDS